MADKNENYNQNRRDAIYWAQEWEYKRKKKRVLAIIGAIVAAAVIGVAIYYISIIGSRTVFHSEEEMRSAIQGRYVWNTYEAFCFDGDDVTLTYYNVSHYDREYAERYGYEDYDDSVYEDKVVKWDYRKGVIKCNWMSEIIVDRDGNLVYYHQTFKKTNQPAPEPIDPTTLSNYNDGSEEAAPEESYEDGYAEGEDSEVAGGDTDITEDEQATESAESEQQKSLEETQEAAEEAGIIPESEDTPDAI